MQLCGMVLFSHRSEHNPLVGKVLIHRCIKLARNHLRYPLDRHTDPLENFRALLLDALLNLVPCLRDWG